MVHQHALECGVAAVDHSELGVEPEIAQRAPNLRVDALEARGHGSEGFLRPDGRPYLCERVRVTQTDNHVPAVWEEQRVFEGGGQPGLELRHTF